MQASTNLQPSTPQVKDLAQIDKNLMVETTIARNGLCFYDAEKYPFRIYGVTKEDGLFRRMPSNIAQTVSDAVYFLHTYTAGGRVRFVTDSPYVAIRAQYASTSRRPHFPLTCSSGFDMYAEYDGDNRYVGTFVPPVDVEDGYESVRDFSNRKEKIITIHFPHYSEVSALYIGLKDDAYLKEAPLYETEIPVVYYGSSITQGAGSSRPGRCYENILSRRLNCNHINLGFAGNAKGEPAMAEYISTLDMSVFVLDYDYNAPSVEHLRDTHERFFRTIRSAKPKLPIIIMSRPKYYLEKEDQERREIIYNTFLHAKAAGDRNVYFIGGDKLMELAKADGTVDNVHPTDFGYQSMANAIEGVLAQALNR